MDVTASLIDQLMDGGPVERRLRFAIHADNLLARGMGHSSEHAGFGDGGASFNPADAAHRNALSAERLKKQAPGLVVANDSHRQYGHAQVGQVINRIARAAWNY